jgi:hypothetical protein
MKIIWKAIHFSVSYQLKNIICEWMDLIISILAATNQPL